MRVKEHKLCLKHIPKSSYDVRKLENESVIVLHSKESGHAIDYNGTRVLQKGFTSYKEKPYTYERIQTVLIGEMGYNQLFRDN